MKKSKPKYDDWCGNCELSRQEHEENLAELARLREENKGLGESARLYAKEARIWQVEAEQAEAKGRREVLDEAMAEFSTFPQQDDVRLTYREVRDILRALAEPAEDEKPGMPGRHYVVYDGRLQVRLDGQGPFPVDDWQAIADWLNGTGRRAGE